MTIKNKSIFLVPASIVILLAGFFLLRNNQVTDKIAGVNDDKNLDIHNKSISSNLVIDAQRCIGCGRCTKIAPTNFKMDNDSKRAIVVSQEKFNNNLISRAIKECPVAAISLN